MASSTASRGWAAGGTVFAGTMLVLLGIFDVFQGIAAIAKKAFFVVDDGYAYQMNVTGWGWIHLILGALLVVVGAAVLAGQAWARWTGIFLAALAAINNFFFLPYYPLWSLVVIALAVFSIWALANYSEDSMVDEPGAAGVGWSDRDAKPMRQAENAARRATDKVADEVRRS